MQNIFIQYSSMVSVSNQWDITTLVKNLLYLTLILINTQYNETSNTSETKMSHIHFMIKTLANPV